MPAFVEALWNDAYLRATLETMLDGSDIGAQLVIGETTFVKTATGWKEVAVVINGESFSEAEAKAALQALKEGDKVEVLTDATFNVDHNFVAANYTLGQNATLTVQKNIVAAVGTKLTVGANATIVVESGAHIDISNLTKDSFKPSSKANLEIQSGAKVTMPAFVEQLWNDTYLRATLEAMLAGSQVGAELVIGDTTWKLTAQGWEEVVETKIVVNGQEFTEDQAQSALNNIKAGDQVTLVNDATVAQEYQFAAANYTLAQDATLTVQANIVAQAGTKLVVGAGSTIVVENGAHIDISNLTKDDFKPSDKANLEIANGAKVTMPAFVEQLWNNKYIGQTLRTMLAGSEIGAELVIGNTVWTLTADGWTNI
jgi:hypothetical protein